MGDPLLEMAHVFEMRQRGRRALEEGNKKEDLQGLFQQQSATSFSPASLMVYSSDTHTHRQGLSPGEDVSKSPYYCTVRTWRCVYKATNAAQVLQRSGTKGFSVFCLVIIQM